MDSSGRRIAYLVVSFLFLVSAFATQTLKLDQKFLEAREVDLRKAETTYMPPNEMVNILSAGYQAFVSDLVFMSANNYFATHLSFDRKYTWLDTYIDAVIGYCRGPGGVRVLLPPDECAPHCESDADCPGNDRCIEECDGQGCTNRCWGESSPYWVDGLFPFNPRVYLWASQVIKFAPLLTNEIIDRSIYYGKTGIYFCPDNWELYFDVGFNYYFEYRDKSQEEKLKLRLKGLDYLTVAARLPGSSVDPNFVAGNLWQKKETERAIQQIYLTYYHATDAQRKEIRTRARAYGKRELADLFEEEEKAWQAQYHYLPQSLFHMIGAHAGPTGETP